MEKLLQELRKGKTFEQIANELNYTSVECIGNTVYEDTTLYEFLKEQFNASIEDYGVGYVLIHSNSKWYEVPYEEIENRFGNELPNETILHFEWDKIYDVTTNGGIKLWQILQFMIL